MLTAYDHPTAAAAAAAGVDSLLIGDSLGCVLLGRPNTRGVPLELMVILGEAVRRGAPGVFLIGDVPFQSISAGVAGVTLAARRFVDESGCDAVKVEVGADDAPLVDALVRQGVVTMAHLGLRPQTVLAPDGYRAQARDVRGVAQLVADCQRMAAAGAQMLLLEAVPHEAAAAVCAAVDVPVIGCGAGAACHGHVVVTQDLLGWTAQRPPRFVPVAAQLHREIERGLRTFVDDVHARRYPAAEHMYPMRAGE